jgi:NAD-specific glutamate dehydrogenase
MRSTAWSDRRLPWRDVALLRAYARYLKQIRLGFDLGYIASTRTTTPTSLAS